MAPVVPGFTTQRHRLEATVRAIADHDAAFMGANVLYLKGGTRDHFMGFLRSEFPHLVERYEHLYSGAYAPKPYVTAVKTLIDSIQDRFDIGARGSRKSREEGGEPAPAVVEQPALWDTGKA
jgi:hypothetical protein